MITKQKIKRLEDKINNSKKGRHIVIMKHRDKELYAYGDKFYNNLDDAEKDLNICPKDLLVIITDFGLVSFPQG
ncbi:MAG: hypothetical protein MUF50_04625 [Planctomycetes bacterium]|jgi:hypothetical protein|nr:hypothetical protein [Planctomycetota bacterium]